MPPVILSRPQPVGAPAHYRTYTIRDAGDRAVVAACRGVGCEAWRGGWESAFDEADTCGSGPGVQCLRVRLGRPPCGSCAAQYVRLESGRTFTEARSGEGLTVFRFEPYQRCFREHRTAPRLYVRRHGDWRGNPSGDVLRHERPQDWVEDFALNQQRLADAIQRG